ncbi:hypothetical protein NWF32_31290 [Pseudomonas qingdaonensis]|nr:hypothetical protein [Pseudomonas qingdaonensis]
MPMLPGTTTEDGKSFIPADPESPVRLKSTPTTRAGSRLVSCAALVKRAVL